jgi:hypothetical protein
MKQTNNYEITHPGASLSYKGVSFPSGAAIGFTAWAVPMLAGLGFLFNETAIKPAKEYFKAKQKIEINQLHIPKIQKEDLVPNKLFDIEKTYATSDKLAVNKTYQVMPTFENMSEKYLN